MTLKITWIFQTPSAQLHCIQIWIQIHVQIQIQIQVQVQINWIIRPVYCTSTNPPRSSHHHREIQPSTMHCTEYLLSGFPRRNLRIAWIFKRILCRNTARREISFAKTFRIQKIFEKRWSAGLEIPGGKIEEGSDKLRDISAKSASCKSNHPAVTFKRNRIISTIISCLDNH